MKKWLRIDEKSTLNSKFKKSGVNQFRVDIFTYNLLHVFY